MIYVYVGGGIIILGFAFALTLTRITRHADEESKEEFKKILQEKEN
jgi:uncharacterized membrane protein YgaE (UPF0421/DUF939 family)